MQCSSKMSRDSPNRAILKRIVPEREREHSFIINKLLALDSLISWPFPIILWQSLPPPRHFSGTRASIVFEDEILYSERPRGCLGTVCISQATQCFGIVALGIKGKERKKEKEKEREKGKGKRERGRTSLFHWN